MRLSFRLGLAAVAVLAVASIVTALACPALVMLRAAKPNLRQRKTSLAQFARLPVVVAAASAAGSWSASAERRHSG